MRKLTDEEIKERFAVNRLLRYARETVLTSTGYAAPEAYVDIETEVMKWHIIRPNTIMDQRSLQDILWPYGPSEVMDWALCNDRVSFGHHPAWGEEG